MKSVLAMGFILSVGALLGFYTQPQSPVEFSYVSTITRPNDAPVKPVKVVQPVVRPAPPKVKTVTLYPVTAIGSQKTIDQGKLVTWMTSPTCLLAGHNNRGWSFLDDIANGTIVIVKTGPCVGSYKVVGHRNQKVKGGPVPSWMVQYPLILQTCTSSGLGFSLLVRA